MTQEQKAKAYDRALEIAKAWCKLDNNDLCNDDLEKLFPELKESESEDEKIRKWIIDDIRYNMNNEPLNNSEYKKEAEKAIAWLEKQGKEEYALKSSKHEDVYKFMEYIEKNAKAYEFNLPNRGYDIYAFAKDILVWLEKQGEQKHADKVQPKFHKGEWIVYHGTENIYHVIGIVGNQYQLKYGDNYTIQKCTDVDRCARLWDITKDAKDGDVLVHNGCTFIFKGIKDGIVQAIEENILEPVSFGKPDEDNDYHPATKEQRDLLFKKMDEAGFMWDSDSK